MRCATGNLLVVSLNVILVSRNIVFQEATGEPSSELTQILETAQNFLTTTETPLKRYMLGIGKAS